MRVIATKLGFYRGSRVREGQVFEVPDGLKGKWFKPYVAADSDLSAAKPKRKAKGEPETFGEIARQDAATLDGKPADDLV